METISFEEVIKRLKSLANNNRYYVTNYIPVKHLRTAMGIDVAENNYCLCLCNMMGMNDELELHKNSRLLNADPSRLFLISFTWSDTESIPMWLMYGGKDYESKASYSIKLTSLIKYVENAKVYGVSNNKKDLLNKGDYSLVITKVLYGHYGNEGVETNEKDSFVIGTNEYKGSLGDLCNKSREHLNLEDNLVGKIKNSAWKSEREIRVLVQLKKETSSYDRVLIEVGKDYFSDIIIKRSPWDISQDDLGYKCERSLFVNQLQKVLPSERCCFCEHLRR